MSTGTQIEVVMPQMGVSVSEGTVTTWLKQQGETVERDEPLLEISTDKVDTEVPSPGEGVVAEILVREGETVEVGTVLAVIAPEGGAVEAPAEPPRAAPAAPSQRPLPDRHAERGRRPPSLRLRHPSPAGRRPAGTGAVRVPRRRPDRRRARRRPERGRRHRPGRPRDEEGHPVVHRAGAPAAAAPARGASRPAAAEAPAPAARRAAPRRSRARRTRRPAARGRPASRARVPPPDGRGAASPRADDRDAPRLMEHMRRSLDTSAHVTSAIEVDMSRIVAAREPLKPEFERSYGVNPTYLAFIGGGDRHAEGLAVGQRRDPRREDRHPLLRQPRDRGLARGGKGLIVPVIRNAEGLNLLGIARSIADLAERARTKKLLPDDVQGGTFTITNPGGYGTFHGTPIISQPQAGILGTTRSSSGRGSSRTSSVRT